MEKTVAKPIDETSFKPFLNTIQQGSSNLPIECDNDMILIAFAGPTIHDIVRRIRFRNLSFEIFISRR